MKKSDFLKSRWMDEARKPNAESRVRRQFGNWVKRVHNRGLVEKAGRLWKYLTSGECPGTDKLFVIGALLYLISPFDLIPDSIPVIGWMDDLAIATFVLNYLNNKLDAADLEEEIEGTENLDDAAAQTAMQLNSAAFSAPLAYEVEELRQIATDLGAEPQIIWADRIESRLERASFRVLFLGKCKAGKSSLINAMLGRPCLPERAIPVRRPVTYVLPGDRELLCSEDHDGSVMIHPSLDVLSDAGAPSLRSCRRISVVLPGNVVPSGTCYVDSPGLEDPDADKVESTYDEIGEADAIVYVIDASYPIGQAEDQQLQDLLGQDQQKKIFFVVNKCDTMAPEDVSKVVRSVQARLEEIGFRPRVFQLSAQGGQIGKDPGFDRFKTALMTFLQEGRSAEQWRLVGHELDCLAMQLREVGQSQLEIAAASDDARQKRLSEVREVRHQVAARLQEQESQLDHNIERIKADFFASFRCFCTELEAAIQADIRQQSLESLRRSDGLAVTIKERTREFLEAELEKVHSLLNSNAKQSIKQLWREFQELHLTIQVQRDGSVIKDNPEILTAGLLLFTYPIMGLWAWLQLAIPVIIGRNAIEKILEWLGNTVAGNQLRSAFQQEIAKAMAKYREQLTSQLDRHFVVLRDNAMEELRGSAAKMLGELPAVEGASSSTVNTDDVCAVLRRLERHSKK